jgi:hypothetical protein
MTRGRRGVAQEQYWIFALALCVLHRQGRKRDYIDRAEREITSTGQKERLHRQGRKRDYIDRAEGNVNLHYRCISC